MPAPDDPLTAAPAEFPDDLATLRVSPPSPAAMPNDMPTIVVPKPVAALLPKVAVMGANPDSPVPFVFGKRIAKGGMGAILEGEDCKLGRIIAVKVMLDANASDDQARRLVEEAAVLGKLAHPNIVPVYDLGRDSEGALYYTMKLVKGRTLQDILDDLRREEKEALEHYTLDRLLTIFRKVCDALAFAHASNIIHRDLKPENVMVGEFGEVLVMDWGIAKILGGSSDTPDRSVSEPISGQESPSSSAASFTATMEGAIMGTPNYMSPEQAMGKVNELDERSDIFSLGGILYAILTLRPPVEGKDVWEVLEKVQMANITAPTTFGATTTGKGKPGAKGEVLEAKKITPLPHMPGGRVPNALSAVAMKALTLDKAKRYQNVAEFSADIEAYQGGFATRAEQASALTQLKLLMLRHKAITASLAAMLLLSVGFVLKVMASERKAARNAETALLNEQAAKVAEADAVHEKEITRHALAKSAFTLAESGLREGNGPEMQAALQDVPEDLRDSTWQYLMDQSDTSIARVKIGDAKIEGVAAHPKRPGVFAVTDTNGKVTLMEVRTGVHLLQFAPVFPTQTSVHEYRVAFSPDGERIAVGRGRDGGIVVHSAQDGKQLLAWDAPTTSKLEFSPDGKLLLQLEKNLIQIEKNNRNLNLWDTASGQRVWTYMSSWQAGYTRGTFTLDGQVLTFGAGDDFRLVNARDGALIRSFNDGARFKDGRYITEIVMSTDGTAVFSDRYGFVTRLDLLNGRVLSKFRAHESSINFLGITPGGEKIITAVMQPDGRQTLHIWQANTGERLQTLLGGSGEIDSMSLHPLSGELLVGGANSRAWSPAGTPPTWVLSNAAPVTSIAFWASDDQIFATTSTISFALHKLQADAGNTALLWRHVSGNFYRPCVSADGRIAAVGWSNAPNGVALLRNPGPGVEQFSSFIPGGGPSLLRLSPAGDRLAVVTSSNFRLELFDAATGNQPVKMERTNLKRFWDLGWLDNGRKLVGLVTAREERGIPGTEEWVVLWDNTTGKIVQIVSHDAAMDVLSVAPDGHRFAEAGADKLVRIRDAETLAVQKVFRAHNGPITALAWHPNKPILATASTDLSVRLWNIETGKRMEEFRGPLAPPVMLAFSPSGQRLGCATPNDAIRIWEPLSLNDKPVNKTERPPASRRDAEGWEDLLAQLSPASLTQAGNGWKMHEGELISPNKQWARLLLPGTLSNTSYQVRVKIRKRVGKNCFHLELPVADRMVGFEVDGFPSIGHYTGLIKVNGRYGKDLPGNVLGEQVKDTEPHELEVIVRLDGANVTITAVLDSHSLYTWSGPINALSQDSRWLTPPGSLALGTMADDWVVSAVKVKRLEK